MLRVVRRREVVGVGDDVALECCKVAMCDVAMLRLGERTARTAAHGTPKEKGRSGVVGSDALNFPVRRAKAADWLVPAKPGP